MPRNEHSTSPFQTERTLSAQRLAQYVARGRCERHLRFTLFPSECKTLLARYGIEIEPLSPLLSGVGLDFERVKVEELSRTERVVDLTNTSFDAFTARLREQPEGRTFYYQPSLRGHIGGWSCEGRADLIEMTRAGDGRIRATVIDIKASRRETVGFRLQVAFYVRLLAATLGAAGLPLTGEISGAILARDSAWTPGGLSPFDLTLYTDEIERLVAAPDSDVARAARTTFLDARYHLRPSCDGCPYNVLCFTDTAEREDLSLVPLLTVSEKRALQSAGIETAREVAALMEYGARGAMQPVAEHAAQVRRLGARWPLGSRLPVLAQRARAALSRIDRRTQARTFLSGADYGSLPDASKYPDLVRVFVDAQRDYLADRLYLVASHVAGPRGACEVVEMTAAAPDDADATAERNLLVAWMQQLLTAIGRVADAQRAPVHVYLYGRRGESALLNALRRHFDALCAIPAFYDLLTSSPALSQGMVSFLSDEVRARLNLAPVCQNLYEVADALGFEWSDGETDFRKVFRARVFDNRRRFMRDDATGQLRQPHDATPHDDEDDTPAGAATANVKTETISIEAAARFGAEIPLEYAYAAWGHLRETATTDERARAQRRGFANVTTVQLRAFAVHRTRALRHIEESFAYKNKRVEKEPLDLSRLDEVAAEPHEIPLHRSLEDFLLLEHHASFQERLLHLSMPPRERAETGRTALLQCERYERNEDREERAWFRFVDADGNPSDDNADGNPSHVAASAGATTATTPVVPLRFRAGDWTILNPLADGEGRALAASMLVRGRLATVEELDDEGRVVLRLLPMSFKNSPFRYPHRLFVPDAGAIYTIDEMADDLNSDKFLEACRHASSNVLYGWLDNPAQGQEPRMVRPKRVRAARELAEMAAAAQAPGGLTRAQASIVGEHLTERVLVVQGPPGTGKSHTLGYAILSRALAQATEARPFRVAVLAKTHAAVEIALKSVARRTVELTRAHGSTHAMLAPLRSLKLVKVCNDAGDSVPPGVEAIVPDGTDEQTASEQWSDLLAAGLVVVGGTPGGLYNLVKKGAAKGRAVDWRGEYFDLVVVDEASQMGLAEALTAAAFLRADGQFIAVGDHRQMPPILAHAWDSDSRRHLAHTRPHLSIFETLRALGFARAALDESFRIPSEIADFLRRHVYAADDIDFRSRNRERLGATPDALDGWLAAALAPEHALVVIEHDEAGSQQSNEFEATLIEALIRAVAPLNLDARAGLGIVVPHRAQKALLASRLPAYREAIDTVERFQGGERDLIILSATVSDREFAESESGFLLEPRRLTVAVSRPKRKLIVVASRAVFDLIPGDLDEYERGALWKQLHHEAGAQTLWQGTVGGQRITVRTIAGAS